MPSPMTGSPLPLRVLLMALVLPLLVAGGAVPLQAAPATPPPATPRTLGELENRVTAAWTGVHSYRSTTTLTTSSADTGDALASPGPVGAVVALVDDVVLPDRRRRMTRIDGEVAAEAIAIAGRLCVRGTLAEFAGGGANDDAGWVEVDLAAVDSTSQIGIVFAELAGPIQPPLADLPLVTRLLPLTPLGPQEVGGRRCDAYRVALKSLAVELTVALGADDLLCSQETRTAGGLTRVAYDAYDLPLAIEPPVATRSDRVVPTEAGGDG